MQLGWSALIIRDWFSEQAMAEDKSVHQLLVALKNGDIASIEEIYKKCSVSLYWTAYQMRCSYEDPEDSVHQALVAVIDEIEKYDEKRAGGLAWMSKILTNHILDVFRKNSRVGPLPTSEQEATTHQRIDDGLLGGPEPGSDLHLRSLCIHEARDKLEPEERAALDARLSQGRGRPPAAFYRARDRFEALLRICDEVSLRTGREER